MKKKLNFSEVKQCTKNLTSQKVEKLVLKIMEIHAYDI